MQTFGLKPSREIKDSQAPHISHADDDYSVEAEEEEAKSFLLPTNMSTTSSLA